MKFNKRILTVFFLFLILFICLGSAYAQEGPQESGENNTGITGVSGNDPATPVNAAVGTFTNLKSEIGDGKNITLTLNRYRWVEADGNEPIVIKNPCVIDGNGAIIDMFDANSMRIFNVECDGVTFKNITFEYAKYDPFAGNVGGVVYFQFGGTVIDCTFWKNRAYANGGALYFGSEGHVINSTFFENEAYVNLNRGDGGAVYFKGNGDVIGCTFTKNTARERGGAIYFAGRGNVSDCSFTKNQVYGGDGGVVCFQNGGSVTDCNFTENEASAYGGAICFFHYSLDSSSVTGCSFITNHAGQGGAVCVYNQNNDESSVIDCSFENNCANNDGGAVYFLMYGTVTNCSFTNNKATGNTACGGAIKMGSGSVTNCSFINNSASFYSGGAIEMGSGSVTNCNFTDNTAHNDGGAIHMNSGNVTDCSFTNNSARNGGAIYFSDNINNVTVLGCFKGNNAERAGGAIYVRKTAMNNNFSSQFYDNNARQASGGAIFFYSLAENNSFESIFKNNYALYGGGIFFYKKANNNRFNSNFTSNIAKSCGGAIFFYNTTDNNNFTGYFTNNSALGEVDETVGNGGAITFKDVSTNCIFTGEFINNTAALNGGAVNYRQTPHNITFNCNFINNKAPKGGGVNFFGSFENIIFNGEFINNSAISGGAIAAGEGSVKEVSFKNNHAKNGGAIYFSQSGTVENCSFTNNKASKDCGGAVYFGSWGAVIACSFINNSALIGSAIYLIEGSGSSVQDSIFINNGVYTIFGEYDSIPVNNSWFGNNATNYDTRPNAGASVNLLNWLFLNATANPNAVSVLNSSDISFKLFAYESSQNVSDYDNTRLMPVNLTLTSTNGNLNVSSIKLGESVKYTANSTGTGSVTASIENIFCTIEVETIKKNLTLSASADAIVEGGNVTVVVLFNSTDVSGEVRVAVVGEVYNASVKDGKAIVSVPGLVAGNYTADVSYMGDETYNPAKTSVNITVGENTTLIVTAPSLVKYYNGPEKFIVTVSNYKGDPLANKSVNITIGGVTYHRTTDAEGIAVLDINLDSGEYGVCVSVDDVEVNSSVLIKSTIYASDLVKVFRNASQYYANFLDVNGNPLINASVSFNINGVIYNRTTDGNGSAKLNINLDGGEYILTATNGVTGEMKSNLIKVISLVESGDLTKYFRNASQFVVRIHSADGGYVGAGEEVKFNINGVIYTRTTNATGHAKLNINLDAGNYTITTQYKNCSQGNNIEVLSLLNATDLEMKYMDGSQFKARLVDGQGNAYPNQKITFNINGVLYNRTTDSSGVAKLNIRLMPGEYIITSSFNECAISNKIKITA